MKVLFVQPYVSFEGVISDTLPGQLAKRGHKVEVVSYSRKKNRRLFSEGLVTFHSIDALSISIPNFVNEFPYFLNLEKAIKQIQPDVIHINNLPFLTTHQSTQIAKKLGIPTIVQVHGVIGQSNSLLNLAQYSFIKTIGHSVFRDTTFLICLTESDAIEIQNYGCPFEKIWIIPNGVDVVKFKPFREVDSKLVIWGGRFVPQKGLGYLIKALYLVAEKEPAIKLVMTGDGPLFSKIYNMVQDFGLERNVIFKGRVTRDELPGLIGASSLYVLPSLKEGMPYALLEAMACGKPVIGSDIPGIKDVITHGKNGILVPPKKTEALANSILGLLIDENLRIRLGQNARQLMVENYSWNTIVQKVERLYCETITS